MHTYVLQLWHTNMQPSLSVYIYIMYTTYWEGVDLTRHVSSSLSRNTISHLTTPQHLWLLSLPTQADSVFHVRCVL